MAGERARPRAVALEPVAVTSAPTAAIRDPHTAIRQERPITEAPIIEALTTQRAATSGRRPSWLVAGSALLLATTAMATSLALWSAAEDRRTLAGNQAAAASSAGAIVEKMLAYDYKNFDRHTTEVSALLTGSFRNEFIQAATIRLRPLALQNQAVVLAKASEVSVMSTPDLDGHVSVKILAFVDQTTTSAKLERPQIDQNRVILTMSRVDGRWLVSKVEAF